MYIFKSSLSHENFPRCGAYAKRYLKELDTEYGELINTPIPALGEELFAEYEKTGSRIGYERLYFLRRTMLRDYALKAWLGGEAEPLGKIITAICSEKTWALPAHASGADKRTVIDLFAAETAQSLTEIISLVGGRLSGDVKEMALNEVKSRVLMPFINRNKPYNWESMKSNWCAVCGGAVGMTAIYLIEDRDRLKHILKSLEGIFISYMESFSDDGACLEGLYYWGYGMTYLTAFLDLYRQRMGEDFPVNTEKLVKMADFAHKCCISDGITVSFSDGNERDRIYSGLSAYLTRTCGAKPLPLRYRAYLLGDDCGRWCRAVRDIAWTEAGGNEKTEAVSVLPEAQWAVLRGGECSLAIKGGSNGEPHNHNDIGSFIAVKDGAVILCDLGAGEYTREYFSDGRYNVFCTRSIGHSVPIIDGREQKAGGEYGARGFSVTGKAASADISGAYDVPDLKKCVRTAALSENGITVTDEYQTEAPIRITERFITRHGAKITDDGVMITADNKSTALLTAKAGCKITITVYTHCEHDGAKTDVMAIDFTFTADGETKFTLDLQ